MGRSFVHGILLTGKFNIIFKEVDFINFVNRFKIF